MWLHQLQFTLYKALPSYIDIKLKLKFFIPVACASFTLGQLSINMLQYSALQIPSLFSNDLLWLTLHKDHVNDHLLDNCEVSSLLYYCGCMYLTKPKHLVFIPK